MSISPLAGTGTATLKTSKNITLVNGSSITTVNGSLTLEANQQVTATSGDFTGVLIDAGLVQATGVGAITVKGKGARTRQEANGALRFAMAATSSVAQAAS